MYSCFLCDDLDGMIVRLKAHTPIGYSPRKPLVKLASKIVWAHLTCINYHLTMSFHKDEMMKYNLVCQVVPPRGPLTILFPVKSVSP